MNLIEQQNVLKGLTDEHLTQEINAPSGSAPPFLVLTEINRRKSQRERYEGDRARQGKPTTVTQDLMMGGGQPSMPSAMPQPAGAPPMGGLDAALPPQTAFADGGIVGADGQVDYGAIGKRYSDTLADLPAQRDRARAMALISAGAGIMSGGSSNFLTNLGRGIAPAVDQYGKAMSVVDSSERDALRDLTSLGQSQNETELQRMDREWRERRAVVEDSQFQQNLAKSNSPAAVKEFEYYQDLTPEEQAAYDRRNPPYNPNAVTNDMRAGDTVDKIYADVQKTMPVSEWAPETEKAAALLKQKQAAYLRIKAAVGSDVAARWAQTMGLAEGDIVLGATGAATPPSATGASAVPFDEYFK